MGITVEVNIDNTSTDNRSSIMSMLHKVTEEVYTLDRDALYTLGTISPPLSLEVDRCIMSKVDAHTNRILSTSPNIEDTSQYHSATQGILYTDSSCTRGDIQSHIFLIVDVCRKLVMYAYKTSQLADNYLLYHQRAHKYSHPLPINCALTSIFHTSY